MKASTPMWLSFTWILGACASNPPLAHQAADGGTTPTSAQDIMTNSDAGAMNPAADDSALPSEGSGEATAPPTESSETDCTALPDIQQCGSCFARENPEGANAYMHALLTHIYCGESCSEPCSDFCEAWSSDPTVEPTTSCGQCASEVDGGHADVTAFQNECNTSTHCVRFAADLNRCREGGNRPDEAGPRFNTTTGECHFACRFGSDPNAQNCFESRVVVANQAACNARAESCHLAARGSVSVQITHACSTTGLIATCEQRFGSGSTAIYHKDFHYTGACAEHAPTCIGTPDASGPTTAFTCY